MQPRENKNQQRSAECAHDHPPFHAKGVEVDGLRRSPGFASEDASSGDQQLAIGRSFRVLQAAFPGLLPVTGCDFLAYSCAAARELHPLPCLRRGAKTRKPKDISKNENSGQRNLAGKSSGSQPSLRRRIIVRELRSADMAQVRLRKFADSVERILQFLLIAFEVFVAGVGRNRDEFAETKQNARKRFRDDEAVPGVEDPGALDCDVKHAHRNAGGASQGHGTRFLLV